MFQKLFLLTLCLMVNIFSAQAQKAPKTRWIKTISQQGKDGDWKIETKEIEFWKNDSLKEFERLSISAVGTDILLKVSGNRTGRDAGEEAMLESKEAVPHLQRVVIAVKKAMPIELTVDDIQKTSVVRKGYYQVSYRLPIGKMLQLSTHQVVRIAIGSERNLIEGVYVTADKAVQLSEFFDEFSDAYHSVNPLEGVGIGPF
jgi:hypothetical protein